MAVGLETALAPLMGTGSVRALPKLAAWRVVAHSGAMVAELGGPMGQAPLLVKVMTTTTIRGHLSVIRLEGGSLGSGAKWQTHSPIVHTATNVALVTVAAVGATVAVGTVMLAAQAMKMERGWVLELAKAKILVLVGAVPPA